MGTIPTITTFTAGAVLTAAQLNNMKAVSDFWALTPRCSVYQQTTPTSIPHSAGVSSGAAAVFDAELFDIVQSGDTPSHDVSTNAQRVYIRTAGKYEIAGQIQFASSSTGIRVAKIILNSGGSFSGGTALVQNSQGALSGGTTSCACPPIEADLSVGDYVEVWGAQSSGGSLNTAPGQDKTWLRIKLVGA